MVNRYMTEKTQASSMIRAMFNEGKRLAALHGADSVYDYSLGNPIVPPPKAVTEAIKKILGEMTPGDVHGYMNNAGHVDVREKLAAYENSTKGVHVGPEHLIMTCGAAGGLNVVLRTVLEAGDEVVTFAPYFAEYNNYCTNADAVLKVVPPDTETFQPDVDALKDLITEKTKIVLINSPNNPSGVIYTEEAIKQLAALLEEKEKAYGHSILLLSDEPYRELVYEDVTIPYVLNYYKNSMVIYSYSKSLSLPGERIGYITVNPDIEGADDLLMALSVANRLLGFVNAPSLFQRVAAEVAGTTMDLNFYKKNRDTLLEVLDELGLSYAKPEGTFYLFVKTPTEDEVAFCNKAKEFNLLLVPGRAFGCPGYIRMSYSIPYENVLGSLEAIRKTVAAFR